MPYNFSFVIPRKLAGMGRLGSGGSLAEDLWILKREGVGALVSLTPSAPWGEEVEEAGFAWLHLPVTDFCAPRQEQVDRFVRFAEENIAAGKAVGVHCGAGLGRTGTMLACYLAYLGEGPDEAMESVRRIRPGSIETPEQEACVRAFAQRCGNSDAEGCP